MGDVFRSLEISSRFLASVSLNVALMESIICAWGQAENIFIIWGLVTSESLRLGTLC